MYMDLTIDIDAPDGGKREYALKLDKSLDDLKQASVNWFETSNPGLNFRDFEQSEVDPCVFLRKDAIVLVYVENCIIVSKDSQTTEDLVIPLKTGPRNFLLTDEGETENYLGVETRPLRGVTFNFVNHN